MIKSTEFPAVGHYGYQRGHRMAFAGGNIPVFNRDVICHELPIPAAAGMLFGWQHATIPPAQFYTGVDTQPGMLQQQTY